MKNAKSSGGKGSSHRGPSSSSAPGVASGGRKSRWESANNPPAPSDLKHSKPKDNPAGPSFASPSLPPKGHSSAPPPPVSGPLRPSSAAGPPFPHPDPASAPPPAPPPYGFHNLERRTIVLADGSVRSYFALPPDAPADPAANKMFPYGPGGRPGFGHGHGPEPGLGLGFEKRFPPPGGKFSPEDYREPPYGRGPGPQNDYWASLGLDGPRGPPEGAPSSLKRKYGEEDDFAWRRQRAMQYGNPNANPNGFPSGSGGDRADYLGRTGSPLRRNYHDDLRSSKQAKLGGEDLPLRRSQPDDGPSVTLDVDPQALKRAFLRISKTINESPTQRKNYLEDGKNGPLQCIVCSRASKDFADVHGLIMHAYSSQNAELRVDHLGLHKALCVLMGWNYTKAPENSKAYQLLSADDAQANREDVIIWPPTIIIHNTNSGRRKDGRMEGMGNKEMDTKLKELGFGGGKSKSIYGKDGHMGVTMVKFANTQAGLKEAERLAEYFESDNCGRGGWARAQASWSGDDDKSPALVKVDGKTGERKRIFYGYLATASDLEKLDFDTRKRAVIKSRRELDVSD